jgi:hypothetical protein
MATQPKPKIAGVKLLRTYKHGWLWVEKRADRYWRLRFGVIFEGTNQADFVYSSWQKPFTVENDLMVFLNKMITHYEWIYDPEPYRGQ